ncbi:MAG: serine hydrolase [Bacteroidetes bacterium]|nr:serine hydrolase [Bacteroidota bacterium]
MKVIILLIALISSPSFLFAQKKAAATQNATLFDNYIQSALQTWKTPGISIAVVKDGNVVFKKGYGVKELGRPDPFTTSTLSTCASTTKAMTAVCIGMLVDDGKLKWTDIVNDILPEFKLSDPYVTSQVTVKDLLTHNAGLGNGDLLWVFGYTRSEILHRMQTIPMAYSLRSSFIYQNLMYMAAGEVIKKVSGKTWDDFITERIFIPLGMSHTYADYSKAPEKDKTGLHFKDNDTIKVIQYRHDDNIGAAGGVWSCSDDMVKWMQFLQDSARKDGKRLLKAETFAELFKPQSFVTESEFYPTQRITKPHWKTYGLGWFQQDYRGQMVQFHTGSLDGLVAIHGMIPEQQCSIYIFGNLDHTEIRHALMFKAFDLWCFNDNSKDWSNDFYKLYRGLTDTAKAREKAEDNKRNVNTKPSVELKAYCGNYSNTTYGNAEVVLENDLLRIKLPNSFNLTLSHWNYDTFKGVYNDWWVGKSIVQFSLDNNGVVSGFSIDGIPYQKDKSN